MQYEKILAKAKEQIKPDQKILKEVDGFVAGINASLKRKKIKAVCVKGGSVAKNTFLKNDHDVDLFVKFDLSYKDKDMSSLLASVLPKAAVRVHGSRDYFQMKQHLQYEIVPVLNVQQEKEAENVTDMSPLHVEWVRKKVGKHKELLDDIRLAKQFCKSCKVYGAESHIKGFSGHILDILVVHYGSFLNLLKATQKWKVPVVIDVEKKLKNPLMELNSSKLSPLIIVDPLQKKRNAAAALSREKLEKFKLCARAFLNRPSESYFTIKPLTLEDIQALYSVHYKKDQLIVVSMAPLQGKTDIVGSKVLKIVDHIILQLKENGFTLLTSSWELADTTLAYFIVKKEVLSETIEHAGPPVKLDKVYQQAFRKKHKKIVVKKGRLYAVEKRRFRKAEDLIKAILKESYVREKVKAISLVKV